MDVFSYRCKELSRAPCIIMYCFSTEASIWRVRADAHRRLITVRESEKEMCDMEILLDECGNLGGNVSGCSSDSVCYLSFFSLCFSISLFVSICQIVFSHPISPFSSCHFAFSVLHTHNRPMHSVIHRITDKAMRNVTHA